MTVVSWEELFDTYAVRQSGNYDDLVKLARRRLSTNSFEDWDKLVSGLSDQTLKWFVAKIFENTPVTERLFHEFMRTAITEPNPNLNRRFVAPCISSFGHRRVNGFLLDIVEHGSNIEIAGAVVALYWANMPLQFVGDAPEYTLEYATEESRAAYLELKDVWARKRQLFFDTFINNDDIDVRRQMLPSLKLQIQGDDSVQRVIQIARQHPDDYIRHRVEVQLGNERLLRPIPERAIDSGDAR
jgi:hypothetical protein